MQKGAVLFDAQFFLRLFQSENIQIDRLLATLMLTKNASQFRVFLLTYFQLQFSGFTLTTFMCRSLLLHS